MITSVFSELDLNNQWERNPEAANGATKQQ